MTMKFIRYFVYSFFLYVSLHAEERITFFKSDITIRKDATMLVTETIDVVSTGKQILRGIVREFPTSYRWRGLTNYVVGFDVKSVTLNGHSVAYRMENAANGRMIYVGSQDRFIPEGKHSYTITYETNRQIGFFDKHDELYWNVTGNGWRLPIDKVETRVQLPNGTPIEKAIAWAGFAGQKDQNYTYEIDGNVVTFVTKDRLHSFQGLTIAVAFAKGFVIKPTFMQDVHWFLCNNALIVIIVLGLLLLLLVIIWGTISAYNTNKPGTIIPLFAPPKGMSPSEVGFMKAMKFKHQLLAADVVDLAVRGFITIDKNTAGDYVLKLKPQGIPGKSSLDVSRYDIKLLSELFKKKETRTIAKDFDMTQELEICRKLIDEEVANYITAAGYFWAASFAMGLCVSLASIIAFIGFQFIEVLMVWGNVALWFVIGSSNGLYKVYTKDGRKLQDEIDGFKLYLQTAELDRMELAGTPPTKTPELYEKFLPYAIALGVEKQWTKQFASLFKDLETKKQPYYPVWYAGRDFYGGTFSSGFSSSFARSIVSASNPPGSSSGFGGSGGGFGGGGSSGGGGGGGGGGGW